MATPDDLLKPAHDGTYRLPIDFAGFTATVHTHDGTTGSLTVRDRRDVALAMPAETPDLDWVRGELASMVGHRWASSYEDGDGRWRKEVSGDLVRFADDPFDSAYRLRDGQIAQVHRTAGGSRFAIVVHDRDTAADGRTLPARFTVFHWSLDEEGVPGRLVRTDHYRDAYALVGGVHLPARREVTSGSDAGLVTRSVRLTGHALLAIAPAAVSA